MKRRELVLKSLRREAEGYIPFEMNLCPSLVKKFKEKYGDVDYAEYFDMPYRFIVVPNKKRKIDWTKYFNKEELTGDYYFTEWGVGHKKGDVEHFTRMMHPMKDFETLDEFQNYPYPDVTRDFDWVKLKKIVEELKVKDVIVVASMAITIFEIGWYLRSMDKLMIDMMMDETLANYHLDKITEIRCEMAENYALSDVDVLHIGDDVSTQLDMMMSPKLWAKHFKTRLKKIIDAAKSINPDIIIDYHGDGNLQKIIPDLIEIGVDVLNPVQPECMNPFEIKEKYGDRLSFRGGLGTQTTMPFGTPDEVRKKCIELIENMGKGGGFILAPTHMLEPEVPWENVEAMLEVIKEYQNK